MDTAHDVGGTAKIWDQILDIEPGSGLFGLKKESSSPLEMTYEGSHRMNRRLESSVIARLGKEQLAKTIEGIAAFQLYTGIQLTPVEVITLAFDSLMDRHFGDTTRYQTLDQSTSETTTEHLTSSEEEEEDDSFSWNTQESTNSEDL